jgi:DNA-binding CsgD family transcriptional regulator
MPTKLTSTLSKNETLEVVRLLGDLSGMNVTLSDKRRLLLGRLARLIKAEGWVWSVTQSGEKGSIDLQVISGGDTSLLPRKALERMEKRSSAREEKARQSTDTKSSRRLKKPAGHSVDPGRQPIVLSFFQSSGDTRSSIIFGREPGKKSFTQQEEEMVRMVIEEVSWIHGDVSIFKENGADFKLPQRQRDILALLRRGLGYKEIADRLQISHHTVHGYVKDIYQHFGIGSRAKLTQVLALKSK